MKMGSGGQRRRREEDDFGRGTLPPAFRASDKPIAMACLRLVTFLPLRPLFSLPCFISCIARSTLLCALRPYFRPLDFLPGIKFYYWTCVTIIKEFCEKLMYNIHVTGLGISGTERLFLHNLWPKSSAQRTLGLI